LNPARCAGVNPAPLAARGSGTFISGPVADQQRAECYFSYSFWNELTTGVPLMIGIGYPGIRRSFASLRMTGLLQDDGDDGGAVLP
jgi:hypothetical protein